jgi:Pyridoxal-phosphate dependent enzyme
VKHFVRASPDRARTWSLRHVCGKAGEFHRSIPGYRPTPLIELADLAVELGIGAVAVKDESNRLGLPAFKILGASWAVNCALSRYSGFEAPARDLIELRERTSPVTLVTATDGNHGRALARVAALLGLPARIYVPAGTSQDTVRAIAGEGADVVQTDLIYDEVVWAAASSTAGNRGDVLIQDTAWTAMTPCSARSTNSSVGVRPILSQCRLAWDHCSKLPCSTTLLVLGGAIRPAKIIQRSWRWSPLRQHASRPVSPQANRSLSTHPNRRSWPG